MKKSFAFCASLAVAGLLTASSAQAVPFNFQNVKLGIDPSSFLTIKLDALSGGTSTEVTLDASGMLFVDLEQDFDLQTGVATEALSLTINDGSEINLSDGALALDLGLFGSLEAQTVGLGVSALGGPFTPPVSSGGGSTIFDIGGTTLSLDQGFITYEGAGFVATLLDPGTFNFVTDPLSVDVPSPATVEILEEQVNNMKNNVTLLIPISVSQSVITQPVDVNATLTALIVATGMKIIPEPTTFVLLGIGVAGFIAVARRRKNS